jgi:hypothetical protein
MRITIFITEDIAQFNLVPENDHEKKFMGMIKDYQGLVMIKRGVSIEETHGGYLRNLGEDKDNLAIVLKRGDSNEPL